MRYKINVERFKMKKSSTIIDRDQCIEELKKKTEDLLHEIAKQKAEIALLDLKKKDLEPKNDVVIDMLQKLDIIK